MQRQLYWAGDFTKAKSTYPSRHPICTDSTIWTALVHFLTFLGRGVKKWYFTVSAPPPPPPLIYGQFFVIVWCSFDLILWLYVFWIRFYTQEKVNFHPTTAIPNSSSYCCGPPDDHLQETGPSFWQPQKGHEKCIFETLHNEIICVLSVKE